MRVSIDALPPAITDAEMVWAVLPDGDKQLIRGEVWLLEVGVTRAPDEAVTAKSVHVRVNSAADAVQLRYALSLRYIRDGVPERTLRAAAAVLGRPVEAGVPGYLATTFEVIALALDADRVPLMDGLADQFGPVAREPGAMIAVTVVADRVLH